MVRYPPGSLGRWSLAVADMPGYWRRRFETNLFARNVAFMLAGTVSGQAASVVLSPVLTRIYSPDQFGYLSVYTAVLSILGVVAALGLDLALPIAASTAEFANLLACSGIALAATVGALSVGMWIMPDHLASMPWLGPLADYRWLLPLGFICLGSYYVMVAAATWLGKFRHIARTRISQGLSGPISQIIFGLLGAGSSGLAIGFVIGQSSGTLLLATQVYRDVPELGPSISWAGIMAALRRYASFPLYCWSRILDVAGSGTTLFLVISACYAPEIAGFMFLTERVIARPLLMISTSLLQVFTGEAGHAVRQEPARFRRRFRQVVPQQFLISAAWISLANLLAGWAFPVLFGPRWTAAIPYLHALSPGYLALATTHPVSTSLQILERQLLAAVWQAGRLVVTVGSVVLAWKLGMTAVAALWIGSIAQVIACIVLLALIAWAIHRIQPQE